MYCCCCMTSLLRIVPFFLPRLFAIHWTALGQQNFPFPSNYDWLFTAWIGWMTWKRCPLFPDCLALTGSWRRHPISCYCFQTRADPRDWPTARWSEVLVLLLCTDHPAPAIEDWRQAATRNSCFVQFVRTVRALRWVSIRAGGRKLKKKIAAKCRRTLHCFVGASLRVR